MLSDEVSGAGRTFWKVHPEKQGTHFKKRGTTLRRRRKFPKRQDKSVPGIGRPSAEDNGRQLRKRRGR